MSGLINQFCKQKVTDPRVREQCTESDILDLETPGAFLLQQGYKASIISGGPNSVYAVDAPLCDPAIFRLWNGGELGWRMVEHGGTVDVGDGQFEIQVETECPLFKGLETRQMTKNVAEILIRYLWIARSFTLEEREQQCNDYIRRTVGLDKIVLMLVSGGVDSTVCAALLHKPLLQGNERGCRPSDGLHSRRPLSISRKDESEQVVTSLQKLRLNLQTVASHLFFIPAIRFEIDTIPKSFVSCAFTAV
ncbi:hypothetical protein OUZ56_019853 [Daphnia magna]|uniref:GMP synthase n=1 Tax=Daphnia magna TaxID=35525 RepID=A0ABQ9ZCT7_9CRUS|nr:hypothetical protein OUZ56_019853 [Daphnia magna]